MGHMDTPAALGSQPRFLKRVALQEQILTGLEVSNAFLTLGLFHLGDQKSFLARRPVGDRATRCTRAIIPGKDGSRQSGEGNIHREPSLLTRGKS